MQKEVWLFQSLGMVQLLNGVGEELLLSTSTDLSILVFFYHEACLRLDTPPGLTRSQLICVHHPGPLFIIKLAKTGKCFTSNWNISAKFLNKVKQISSNTTCSAFLWKL